MRKPATSLLLAFLLVPVFALQGQQPSTPPASSSSPPAASPQTSTQSQKPDATFKVDVNLINVFVTVTDEHGAPIGGLTKDNFVLKEDDRPQVIKVFDK